MTLYPGLEKKKNMVHPTATCTSPGLAGPDVGSRTLSLIEMFVFVALTPYKALFPEALLIPPTPPCTPGLTPTPGVADTSFERRKNKESTGAIRNCTTKV